MTEKSQGIVASAIIVNQGKIFIAKRAATKSFLPNTWEVPGGHVEFGESIEEALVREVKEELGAVIQVEKPIYTFSYFPKPEKHMIEVDCFAQLISPIESIKINTEDHSEMAWITADQIDTYFEAEDLTGKALRYAFSQLN